MRKIAKIIIATLVVIVLAPVWSVMATSGNKTNNLFLWNGVRIKTLSSMMSN